MTNYGEAYEAMRFCGTLQWYYMAAVKFCFFLILLRLQNSAADPVWHEKISGPLYKYRLKNKTKQTQKKSSA